MESFLQNFVSRWDGHSYLFLVQNGYVTKGDEAAFIVFPPFYPLLVRIPNLLLDNPALSALLISGVSIVIGLFIFYKLLRLDYEKHLSIWIVLVLALFPTSYFFLTAYPEALFFLLTVSSFYFARKKNFLIASLCAALATLTRPFGILIWPSLLIEWYLYAKRNWRSLTIIISGLICSSIIYLSINYSLFGNPFAFEVFLRDHWQKHFSLPYVGIIDSWKRGIYTPQSNFTYKYIVGYAEGFASTTPYLILIINLLFKKIRLRISYLSYFILGTILMTSTSFLLSTPRYLLSLPPFFITLGILTQNKFLKIIWLILTVSLLIYFTNIFFKGQWSF